jgi:hypothetical protein
VPGDLGTVILSARDEPRDHQDLCQASLQARLTVGATSHARRLYRLTGDLAQRLRGMDTVWMDREVVHRELEVARVSFHQLVAAASEGDLRRPSNGTRWTNKQLLFHMLLGYLILHALRLLVLLFGRLPDGASRSWARLLNAATRPFGAVNYLGSRLGGTTLSTRRMEIMFDHVIAKLHRRLDAESDADLARGMHYPTRWDPFFTDYMTLADVYHFRRSTSSSTATN